MNNFLLLKIFISKEYHYIENYSANSQKEALPQSCRKVDFFVFFLLQRVVFLYSPHVVFTIFIVGLVAQLLTMVM